YVAGGAEGHPCAAERDSLAITDCLRRGGEVFAVAQTHEIERLLGAENGAVAGARVIGMGVGDHSFVHRTWWLDMEAANLAATPGGRSHENVFGAHGLEIWCKRRNDRCAASLE